MSIILIAVMVLLYTFQSSFCTLYAKHYPGEKQNSSPVYSVFYGCIVAIATFLLSGFSFAPSVQTVIIGCLNGAVLVLYNTMLIKASSNGPFSVTMIFNLCGGILLPLFASVFVDGENLSVWQYASIAVMLVSFVFLNMEDKKSGEKVSLTFLLQCLVLGTANGFYGTFLNTQKKLTDSSEDPEMIVMTFGVSALLAFLLLLLRTGKGSVAAFRQTKKSMFACLCASVSAASAVNLLMLCLDRMNAAVLYSLNNGGVLIISVLWAAVILREKIGKKKIIGLIMAIAAVFALSIL